VSQPRGDRVLSREQGWKGRHLPSLTEVIHQAKLYCARDKMKLLRTSG